MSKGPTSLHSVAHHRRAFTALDNTHKEVGARECKWEEWKWEVLPRGGVASLEAKGLSDGVCLSVLLAFLSSQPEVFYLEHRGLPVKLNQEAVWITQSGIPEHTTAWDAGLTGTGEVIGVADSGVDRYHCHFAEADGGSPVEPCIPQIPTADFSKRKIVQYVAHADDTDAESGHGTHVAGTAAGNTPALDSGDTGMAYGAKIAVFDFGDTAAAYTKYEFVHVPDFDSYMLDPLYHTGLVRVQTNSWGMLDTAYKQLDRDFDSFVYRHPDMLVVASAGNCNAVEGSEYQCDDLLIVDDSTILAPAHAKNVIGVGATVNAEDGNELDTESYSTVAFFSSQGPTPDGRIKPDVVAPGYPIRSASAGLPGHTNKVCGLSDRVGTSMSSPIVAGNAAIIRQYFSQGWYNLDGRAPNPDLGFSPSAALVKAVLINSAKAVSGVQLSFNRLLNRRNRPRNHIQDVFSPHQTRQYHRKLPTSVLDAPPDGVQGFGKIRIDQGININGTVGLFFRDESVAEGNTMTYNVSILPTADTSRDLSVTLVWTDPVGPAGAAKPVLHDLDLSVVDNTTGVVYYPNGLSTADHVNNVEKIVINPTRADTSYIINVAGTVVSETDVQRYSVVAKMESLLKPMTLPSQSL